MKKLLLLLAVPAVQMLASNSVTADNAWESAFNAGVKKADAEWEMFYNKCLFDHGRSASQLCGDAAELRFVRRLIAETEKAHSVWSNIVQKDLKNRS